MTTLQRSAALCSALLAVPICAIVAFRAGDEVPAARSGSHAAPEPFPTPAPMVEQPSVNEPVKISLPIPPSTSVAAPLPTMPAPEHARDYALGADENRMKAELARSDPAGIERPVRLVLGVLSRVTEDPQAEEP